MNELKIRPYWKIVLPGPNDPISQVKQVKKPGESREVSLIVSPGEGWGSGSHETTQLCLQAIALMAPHQKGSSKNKPWRMLDFGSGSGILALGAANLGATVEAIEIDEAGLHNGVENAALNGFADRIRFSRTLAGTTGHFELVVANILRPVLLEFAEELTQRLDPKGTLILSGLVATDLPEVSVRYASFLNHRQPVSYQRGDWRALIWGSAST